MRYLIAVALSGGALVACTAPSPELFATAASTNAFAFSNGSPDGLLGALSQPATTTKLETEAADDFVLTETTVIASASISGLIPLGTSLDNLENVEIEIYHVFPVDSDVGRTSGPPTFSTALVASRVNSPADVEIDDATRNSSTGTLGFSASVAADSFTVANSVVTGINPKPDSKTLGEGPQTGEEVDIEITFTPPIVLPAARYFFRPEVQVGSGDFSNDFLFLSAPKPIPAPQDLQAWIRNSALKPDWLRIGTDIIGAGTFNMTFSLAGTTVREVGTPGQANCHGKSVSALAHQFGSIAGAASALGFASVAELQAAILTFCD
jgi:hypothetical protein